MRLSASDLETIRQHPQQTDLYLSIFRPRPIMKCRINGAVVRNDRIIPYDTVSLGSYLDVKPGMTMLVGSTDGARDIGKIRIRSADSGQFVVAENNDIAWADDLYITVLRFFELWPVFPRIIQDPGNAEDVIFYKDYDVAYTNQNSILGTFVNAGPHRAIFRDCATGIAETEWYSTGTYNALSGTVYNYQWAFEGGTPTGSILANPGLVQYDTPGHYVTSLTVTGTNGAVDTTYRYVSVYDRPGCGPNTPTLLWQLNSLNGSRGEGGYSAEITLNEVVDLNEGDVVVIFSDDWYGNTKQSFGRAIKFVGYVLADSISINYINSTVTFEAGSITVLMKDAEGFSVSVESKRNPDTWVELADMDCRRAMYHYLRWHTTALNISDFQFLGDDQKIQFFDADRESTYDAIDSLMRSALVGSVVSDSQGKMWAEVNTYATPNATGTFIPVMDITKRDWIKEPSISENLRNQISFLEMNGIAYSGPVTGTFSALISNAPGEAPSYRGVPERNQGLALRDQDQLNSLTGNMFAFRNARFPQIDMEMAGIYPNLDIAPQESVDVFIPGSENMSGKDVRGLYNPTSIQRSWSPQTKLFIPRMTLEIIPSGPPGQSVIVPDSPPDEGYSNPDFTSPSFPFSLPVPQQGYPSGTWGQLNYNIGNSPTTYTAQNGVVFHTIVLSNAGGAFATVGAGGIYWVYSECTFNFSGQLEADILLRVWNLAGYSQERFGRQITGRLVEDLHTARWRSVSAGIMRIPTGGGELRATMEQATGGTLEEFTFSIFKIAN